MRNQIGLPGLLVAVVALGAATSCFFPTVSLGFDDAGTSGRPDAALDAGQPDAGDAGDAGEAQDGGTPGAYTACVFLGGLDRISIARKDAVTGSRVTLWLVWPGVAPSLGITTPQGWAAENAVLESAASAVTASAGSGEVSFSTPDAGFPYPSSLAVHVSLQFPGGIERLDADGVPVGSGCGSGPGTWSVVTDIPQPSAADLNGVFATSAGEAWAVGDQSTLLSWDGSRWTPGDFSTGIPPLKMKSVWASAPGAYWLAGNLTAAGFIFRLDNGSWQPTTHSNSAHQLNAVWGTAANNVWAVGEKVGSVSGGVAWNWKGSSWAPGGELPESFLGVGGAGPIELWAVLSQRKLARFLGGGGWGTGMPPAPGDLTGGIWVRGTAPVDVWVTGSGGLLYHFDGFSWTTATTSAPGSLEAIYAASPNDAWAVGATGSLVHFNGGGWSSVASPTTANLHSVHGTGATDIWAVGSGGTVLHYGDGAAGALCGGASNCQAGLLCCYPCGMAGCHDRCLVPDPSGGCPAYP